MLVEIVWTSHYKIRIHGRPNKVENTVKDNSRTDKEDILW